MLMMRPRLVGGARLCETASGWLSRRARSGGRDGDSWGRAGRQGERDAASPGGTDVIDGTQVNGLAANLTLGEMLEAQGVDPEAFVNQMRASAGGGPGGAPPGFDRLIESFVEMEIPHEVWVDGTGYVRRISCEMDMARVLSDMLPAGGLREMSIGSTMDFSDYGDENIEIESPADTVDVTDAFRDLLAAQSDSCGEPFVS
jgi:hypothetical protein